MMREGNEMELIKLCYGPDATLYEVLGVGQEASHKDLQVAFIKRRVELHKSNIDANSEYLITGKRKKSKLSQEQFTEKKMDALADAYKILTDEKKRTEYDLELKRLHKLQTEGSPKSRTDNHKRSHQGTKALINMSNDTSIFTDHSDVDCRETSGGVLRDASSQRSDRNVFSVLSSITDLDYIGTLTSNAKGDRSGRNDNRSVFCGDSMISSDAIDGDDNTVMEYYKSVPVHQETMVGSWLRRNKYKDSAQAVDDFATEVIHSTADLRVSFNQIIRAFTIKDDGIDAITGNIEHAAKEFNLFKYR